MLLIWNCEIILLLAVKISYSILWLQQSTALPNRKNLHRVRMHVREGNMLKNKFKAFFATQTITSLAWKAIFFSQKLLQDSIIFNTKLCFTKKNVLKLHANQQKRAKFPHLIFKSISAWCRNSSLKYDSIALHIEWDWIIFLLFSSNETDKNAFNGNSCRLIEQNYTIEWVWSDVSFNSSETISVHIATVKKEPRLRVYV